MSAEPIYINPLTDFGFKYLFGEEDSKPFLISFLNALLHEEEEIVDVEFINKERLGDGKDERALIYDIYCKTSGGRKFIVEMQNRYQLNFRDRALYYLAHDIRSQGRKGDDWNYNLMPVYGIFLMNFDWKEFEDESLREDIALVNLRTKELFSDKLRMIFFKIPLLEKEASECESREEQWLYILKNMEKMKNMPSTFMKEPIFRQLERKARVAVLSDKERAAYNHSLKVYRDNYAIAETERVLGRAEGLAEGRAEGLAEGRAETVKEMAAKMLAANIDKDTIFNLTGIRY